MLKQLSISFDMPQSIEMERGSNILVDVQVDNGSDGNRKLENLYLGGKVVPSSEGLLLCSYEDWTPSISAIKVMCSFSMMLSLDW
jgi:hypothetical protein